MKKYKLLAVISSILLFGLTTAVAAQPLNKIVAVVNDQVITQSQLNHQVQLIQPALTAQQNEQPPTPAQVEQIALQQLIYKTLQLQAAKNAGITATAQEINNAIQTIAKQNKMSVAQLEQKVQTMENINLAEYRQEIKEQIIISKLQQQAIAPKITITPVDLKKAQQAFQQNQTANIQYNVVDYLIPLSANANKKQIATAQHLAEQLQKQLQKNQSTINTTIQINDLGWNGPNDLPNIFLTTLTKMKKGEVSSPIQAANGIHLLKLKDIRGNANNGIPSNEQLQQMVYQQKFAQQLKPWLTELRNAAYVKIIGN